jgi:hypothetical protein
MPSTHPATRNPLEPLTTTVAVLSVLVAAFIAIGLAAALLGSGSVFGWGDNSVCVEMLSSGLRHTGTGVTGVGLQPGSQIVPRVLGLCTDNPSIVQRIGVTLTLLPSTLLFLGFLLLLHRLLRRAQAEGLYSQQTARQLRTLGWYLISGCLIAETIEVMATGAVAASQTTYLDWLSAANQWRPSMAVLLAGVGLVTFARILKIGISMRKDLEGLV